MHSSNLCHQSGTGYTFCDSAVDSSLVLSLEKIDDDSLEFVTRIQAFVKAVKSRLDNSISYSPRVDQFLKIDCNNDEAWFGGLKKCRPKYKQFIQAG